MFEGFTKELALELNDVREMFELRAIGYLVALPDDHAIWNRVLVLRAEHVSLLSNIDSEFMNFSELDERLHRTINATAKNRFINDFQDLILMIFHYHYWWNKRLEKERNRTAVVEHLTYLDALIDRDSKGARAALKNHLDTARSTLVGAVNW
ncbi:MAG: GntR family transcriptional regulator [Hyphomicrobiales bacterium]|nr:GntR family transcriptional regulator [Hyphomicrobiales bacterium]